MLDFLVRDKFSSMLVLNSKVKLNRFIIYIKGDLIREKNIVKHSINFSFF